MKFIKNKKAMEMKIIMTWLFIIIATLVVIIIIGYIFRRSDSVLEMMRNIF